VARALAACPVPTISAVGHETDFTIADFVADLRAPTPSAAAELLTRDWNDWRQAVSDLRARMERSARLALAAQRRHFWGLATSHALREPQRAVRQGVQRLDDLSEALRDAAAELLRSRRQEWRSLAARLQNRHPARELPKRRAHLDHLAARLRTLGPQGTLDRGYALVLDEKNRPVTRAEKTSAGQPVRLVLGQGVAGAKITGADPKKTLLEMLTPGPAATAVKKRKSPPKG
jgi:exodeoxyribonuclease VII large subunit